MMHTSMLSPSNPMVALLYDDMTQAPVGTIGEEVWILPPVSVVVDPVAWGKVTEYEAGDQTKGSGCTTMNNVIHEMGMESMNGIVHEMGVELMNAQCKGREALNQQLHAM